MQKLHLMPPLKVAEELLLIDSFALRKIQPDELADEAWIGKRKVSSRACLLGNTLGLALC